MQPVFVAIHDKRNFGNVPLVESKTGYPLVGPFPQVTSPLAKPIGKLLRLPFRFILQPAERGRRLGPGWSWGIAGFFRNRCRGLASFAWPMELIKLALDPAVV